MFLSFFSGFPSSWEETRSNWNFVLWQKTEVLHARQGHPQYFWWDVQSFLRALIQNVCQGAIWDTNQRESEKFSIQKPSTIINYHQLSTSCGFFKGWAGWAYWVPWYSLGWVSMTWREVASATRDRPCPTGEHGKTPGGCACVKRLGQKDMPKTSRVHDIILFIRCKQDNTTLEFPRVSWKMHHFKTQRLLQILGSWAKTKQEREGITKESQTNQAWWWSRTTCAIPNPACDQGGGAKSACIHGKWSCSEHHSQVVFVQSRWLTQTRWQFNHASQRK